MTLPRILVPNLASVVENPNALEWRPLRPGIEAHELYRIPGGPAAAILRYVPGARLPRHAHTGYEHVFVLSGSQTDEHGVYGTGAVVLNRPDTMHSVESPNGCIVLVLWEKPVRFVE